ncbi:MAG: DUF2516 family protein [Streptosporangiales bacterium]|nr:DUF2516 family protein [Streptosporangiales bacterium]
MPMFGPLEGFLGLLWLAALGVKAWALVDAAIRPAPAYVAANKQTKPLWLVILVAAVALDLLIRQGFLGLFAIAGLIAAIIYLVDVRPRVREVQGGPSSGSSGPYGPW